MKTNNHNDSKIIKIVQFVEAFGGGVYTYVKDLCNFLAENPQIINCEIHLIYSPNRVEFDEQLFEKEINTKVFLHKFDMQRSINLRNDWKTIQETRKLLRIIKPDIVHLHSAKSGVIGRLACFGIVNKKSVFYSPHGYPFVQQNISNKQMFLYKAIEHFMPLFFGGITIASGDTEYEMGKEIGRTILVRNGVDLKLPNTIVSSKNKNRFTIGTIGRLTPQKNPKQFNEIALKLPNVDFIWIGNGELIDDITAENILVTGWVKSREEMLKIVSTFDVYLQVSLWEGLSIAILEAMALGKPVIATNIVGNKDSVENNKTGYLINTVDEAVEAIMKMQDDVVRYEMGKESYIRCENLFDKEKNFGQLVNVYLE